MFVFSFDTRLLSLQNVCVCFCFIDAESQWRVSALDARMLSLLRDCVCVCFMSAQSTECLTIAPQSLDLLHNLLPCLIELSPVTAESRSCLFNAQSPMRFPTHRKTHIVLHSMFVYYPLRFLSMNAQCSLCVSRCMLCGVSKCYVFQVLCLCSSVVLNLCICV